MEEWEGHSHLGFLFPPCCVHKADDGEGPFLAVMLHQLLGVKSHPMSPYSPQVGPRVLLKWS